VFCAHEVIHSVHKQNLSGLVLILDYEKGLQVSWEFFRKGCKTFLKWYSIVTPPPAGSGSMSR
jgi:hypothetical protein